MRAPPPCHRWFLPCRVHSSPPTPAAQTATLRAFARFQEADLHRCAEELMAVHRGAASSSLKVRGRKAMPSPACLLTATPQACYQKYALDALYAVAKLPPRTSLPWQR